jgi:hypothetical protein
MAVTRTGTASQVNAATSGSTSVTVPGDAELVVATIGGYTGAGTGLASITLNSVAFTINSQLNPGAEHGVLVATLLAPATGSQTVAWSWTGGNDRSEGGGLVLTYVKGNDLTTPVRDSGTDSGTGSDNVEVVIDSESTDLVIGHVHSPTGGVQTLVGTEYVDHWEINSSRVNTSEVTAGSGTTTVTMTGEDYSAMVAISIKQSGAAPVVPKLRVVQSNLRW